MHASKENHQSYNRALQPIANNLRKTATKAENCLWKYALRAGTMRGYTFRRQRPVLNYVADFMCQPLLLIIEVDGGIHNSAEAASADLKRQGDLETAGFTVLRFKNLEVLQQMEMVKAKIDAWIEDYEARNGTGGRAERSEPYVKRF